MSRLFVKENWLLLLLVFVPIALLMEYVFHPSALWIFLASSAAIIPLAALMGRVGVVLTDLRPVGSIRIDGQKHEAISEVGFVHAGTEVRVTAVDDAQIRVRPA